MTAGPATVKAFDPNDGSAANDPMVWLESLFVFFLQNLFREFPEGSGMRWNPDEEMSEIIISSEKPRIEAIEKLPHIVVVLGSTRWGGMGHDQLQGLRVSDGRRIHTDLLPSTVTYHCQAKHGIVARRIAFSASRYTNVYRRALMGRGKLHHVGVQHEIGPESPASAFVGPLSIAEIVSVQATIPFFWQDQWRIIEPAEQLRSIQVGLAAQFQKVYSAGRANEVRPAMVNGRAVETKSIDQDVKIEE